jgi:hypothetical protein
VSLREIRREIIEKHHHIGRLLQCRPRELQDMIDGNCSVREYEGHIICDYTQPVDLSFLD